MPAENGAGECGQLNTTKPCTRLTDRSVVSGARAKTAPVCLTGVTAEGMERSQTEEMAPQVSPTGPSVQARHVEGAD